MTVRNRAGDVLWTHDFGPGSPPFDGEGRPLHDTALLHRGEGLPPDVVVSAGSGPDSEGRLYCFSPDGKIRWERHLDDHVAFRARRFGGSWKVVSPHHGTSLAVYPVDGAPRIAWAQLDGVWWPSVLSVFDAEGNRLARFVHAGVMWGVRYQETLGGPVLLLPSTSNSRATAALVVLDARRPEGSGPEAPGSPYECLDCPPGRPTRYFTFQPSKMVAASGQPYNHANWVGDSADGFEVRTLEVAVPGQAPLAAHFLFSAGFHLRWAAWSDGFAPLHHRLFREGKLDHPLERCPEYGRPPRVREWTPHRGWREIEPADQQTQAPE